MKWLWIGAGVLIVGGAISAAFRRPSDTEPHEAKLEKLFTRHPGVLREGHEGTVGGVFAVGSERDVTVTHLGFYDSAEDGLQVDHRIGIYELSPEDSSQEGELVAEATVPYGADARLEEGYRWVELESPVVLKAKQKYVLAAEVFRSVQDAWPDRAYVRYSVTAGQPESVPAAPKWNEAFVGSQPEDSRAPLWAEGEWPLEPDQEPAEYENTIYGAGNLAFE